MRAAYDPEFARPELPVPMSPQRGLPEFARRRLLGLARPGFGRAHLVTAVWAAVTGAAALTSLLVPAPGRAAAVACSVLLALHLLVRTLALALIERRQHAFEPAWLAAQSEVLRGHAFEVLRFTVADGSGAGAGARAGVPGVLQPRTYDLTHPGDVRDLLDRQGHERVSGRCSRATVEFTYRTGPGDPLTVADVHRELTELTFQQRGTAPGPARIRFPAARYLGQPAAGGGPAQRSYWSLPGPAVLTVGLAVGGPAYGGVPGPAGVPGPGSAR